MCRENPRPSGILLVLFPDRPRFCRLMKTRNRRYLIISDHLGWTGTNLENREHFYFPNASQISTMVGDHSRQMKIQICTVQDISIHQRWISLITNPLKCWAPVPLAQINNSLSEKSGIDLWRISDISAKSGMVGKSKIPDRLGFSRHMKTRL